MKHECARCEYLRNERCTFPKEEGDPLNGARGILTAIWIVCLAIFIVTLFIACRPAHGETDQDLAKQKCRILWENINSETYRPDLADWFVEIHHRAGMGPRWSYSLAYCWSGSNLNPKMVSKATINGEHARGLVDTLWSTHDGHYSYVQATVRDRGVSWTKKALEDPYVAVRLHVLELCQLYDDDPWRNLRVVFLPNSPDSQRAMKEQNGRWKPRMGKMEIILEQARKDGML